MLHCCDQGSDKRVIAKTCFAAGIGGIRQHVTGKISAPRCVERGFDLLRQKAIMGAAAGVLDAVFAPPNEPAIANRVEREDEI